MSHKQIDPTRINTLPLAKRRDLLHFTDIAAAPPPEVQSPAPATLPENLIRQIKQLAKNIISARKQNASVILTYGAHLIKNGCGPLLNYLIENGHVTHLATQGAGIIHDWEFAFQGSSSESVRENAPVGQFGTWEETGLAINSAVVAGAAQNLGFGESVGKFIDNDGIDIPDIEPEKNFNAAQLDFIEFITKHPRKFSSGKLHLPHKFKQHSTTYCAYKNNIPLCVMPGIGYDIFACSPYFHGAAIGRTAATDFHTFTHAIENLTNGLYISVGSAVMSPQVFEKGFSIANNIRHGKNKPFITNHNIAIIDIADCGGWDFAAGEPDKNNPAYYLRFCKSFSRMGGQLDYLQTDNRIGLLALIAELKQDAC